MSCGNFLTGNDFRVIIPKFPGLMLNVQRCTLPAFSTQAVTSPTPFTTLKVVNDHMDFETVSMTMLVDSEMKNYFAMYDWMVALGFPQDGSQRKRIEDDKHGKYSDISVTVVAPFPFLKPIAEFVLIGAFPISISSMELDVTQTDIQPIKFDVTFEYTKAEVKNKWT